MTRLAQSDQIISVMRSTLGQRQLMMNLFGLNILLFPQALLTQWMRRCVGIPDALPRPSVAPAGGGVTLVLLVAFVLLPLVFLTEPSIGQVGAAGIRTGPLWLPWHLLHLRLGIKKALQDGPQGFAFIFLAIVIIP